MLNSIEWGEEKTIRFQALVKLSVTALSVMLGIRAIGFTDSLIFWGFGLALGVDALATAITFGLGSRKVAGELLVR